jgi:hypothetical protein
MDKRLVTGGTGHWFTYGRAPVMVPSLLDTEPKIGTSMETRLNPNQLTFEKFDLCDLKLRKCCRNTALKYYSFCRPEGCQNQH